MSVDLTKMAEGILLAPYRVRPLRTESCPICGGDGLASCGQSDYLPYEHTRRCAYCGGTGSITVEASA